VLESVLSRIRGGSKDRHWPAGKNGIANLNQEVWPQFWQVEVIL
jgi:hypothetical protein